MFAFVDALVPLSLALDICVPVVLGKNVNVHQTVSNNNSAILLNSYSSRHNHLVVLHSMNSSLWASSLAVTISYFFRRSYWQLSLSYVLSHGFVLCLTPKKGNGIK